MCIMSLPAPLSHASTPARNILDIQAKHTFHLLGTVTVKARVSDVHQDPSESCSYTMRKIGVSIVISLSGTNLL